MELLERLACFVTPCADSIRRRTEFHQHLEQPATADMVFQAALSSCVTRFRPNLTCAPAVNSDSPNIEKRTQAWTTSIKVLHKTVEQWQCPESNQHIPIAGSCRVPHMSICPCPGTQSTIHQSLRKKDLCFETQCSNSRKNTRSPTHGDQYLPAEANSPGSGPRDTSSGS